VNRFEELGVARSATSTEIRHAYRNLVRIIHPDHCQDEALRRLAELQMQRLNETTEILLDPVRRQRYEAEIDRPLHPDPPAAAVLQQAFAAGQRQSNIGLAAWCLLAGMVVASLFWFLRESDAPRGLAPAIEAAASRPGPAENGDATLQVRLDELEQRLKILERKPPPGAVHQPSPEAAGKVPGMAGEWVDRLAISQAASPGGLAAEKRVHLTIWQQGDTLRGTYSSGYEVSGGQLSPIMTFRFDGRPSDGLLAWSGSQGAARAIQFRLLTTNTLLASWWDYGASKNSAGHSDTTILHRASAVTGN
jgi:hypothetical protein